MLTITTRTSTAAALVLPPEQMILIPASSLVIIMMAMMMRMMMMIVRMIILIMMIIYRVIFSLVPPLKVLSSEKFIWAGLGVSGPIYDNVDFPNVGFPYELFRGVPRKKITL